MWMGRELQGGVLLKSKFVALVTIKRQSLPVCWWQSRIVC
jgi:hypothetical protein